MTAFHYLGLVPEIASDVMMYAHELGDLNTPTHAAGPQLVNKDRPVLLHPVATNPQPANDNKKLPMPAVPAALNKFMHMVLRFSKCAEQRKQAQAWLQHRWSPKAFAEAVQIFALIKRSDPNLLRRLDPHHTIELALTSRSARHFLFNLKNWQSQIQPSPVSTQPVASRSGRNLQQWQKNLALLYMWRGINPNVA